MVTVFFAENLNLIPPNCKRSGIRSTAAFCVSVLDALVPREWTDFLTSPFT
jgi:hypothetical protein